MIENTDRNNNRADYDDDVNYHPINQTSRYRSIGTHGSVYSESFLASLSKDELRDLIRAESE